MKLSPLLLATVAKADPWFSSGKNGKFADVKDAEAWCSSNYPGSVLAHDDVEITEDNTGVKKWFWQNNKLGNPGARNSGHGRWLSKNSIKDKNISPFAACTKTPVPPKTNCVPAKGKDVLNAEFADHYRFFDEPFDNKITHEAARKVCQGIGAGWDMLIISNSNEFNFVKDVIADNCYSDYATWLGFYENNTPAIGQEGNVTTIFGKPNEWDLKWTMDSDFGLDQVEPNDQKGDEVCIRIKDGGLNDAMCNEGWTGRQKNDVGMNFICEKHNYYDFCEPSNQVADVSSKYRLFAESGLDWQGARDDCKAIGAGWDLAVVNDQGEHDVLVEQINCARNAFWLGQKNVNGDGKKMQDADGNRVNFSAWDEHSNVLNPESNNQQGVEDCVRMRGNVQNDALCSRTWTGPERLGIKMGHICEYTEPECKPDKNNPLMNDEYAVFPQDQPNTKTWLEARRHCQSLGKDWDLIIFNYDREYEMMMDKLKDNCVADHSYWLGYKEENGSAMTATGAGADGWTVFNQPTQSIPLPWDTLSNPSAPEPNDWLGDEKCVRMNQHGLVNDAICSRTWTGGPKMQTGMGFICEKHNPCEKQRGQDPTVDYEDGKYHIVGGNNQYVSANDAKAICQAKGDHWDLVIIDDNKELEFLNDKMAGCIPYWTGMTNPDGTKLRDLEGNPIAFANWDSHLGHGINPPEPNDQMGKETCVRMRGGKYNDALCSDKNGFNKKESMGYICEYTYVPPPPPPPGPIDNCLECGQNKAVLPWETLKGCNDPMECTARLEIVDAWKMGNGKNKPVRYGFVGKIKLPKEWIDKGKAFSVMIRFSKKVTHGHFQLWNMNFWNFYNGGYEVLLHSKWWNTDRYDKYSVAFTAEDLNSDEYPELLFWDGRQTRHHCFDASMHHGQRNDDGSHTDESHGAWKMRTSQYSPSLTEYEQLIASNPHVQADSVTSVRFRNGKIRKVKGARGK